MKKIIPKKPLKINFTDTGTKTPPKQTDWKRSGPSMLTRLRFFEPVPIRKKTNFNAREKSYILRHLEKYRGANKSDLRKIKLNTRQRRALIEHGYVVTPRGVVIPKMRSIEGGVLKGARVTINKNASIRQQVGRQVTITVPITNRADFAAHTEKRLKEYFKYTKRVTEHSAFRLVAGPMDHALEFTPEALHDYLQKQGFFGRNVTAVRFSYYLPSRKKHAKRKKATRGHKRLGNRSVSLRVRAKTVRVVRKAKRKR